MKKKRIVISGGPGAGKTALVEGLKIKGYTTVAEYSRTLIEIAKKEGKSRYFLSDPIEFSEALFLGRKKQFELLNDKSIDLHTPYVFFDRGIHDIYAYLKAIGQESKSWYDRISEYQYDLVFLLTPWEAIYRQDEQRAETFEEASNYFSFIEATYRDAHKVICIPQRSVAERIAFVKDTLKQYE